MTQVSPRQAKSNLDELLKIAAEWHIPVRITGKRSAVLVTEEDWQAIQETLYLLSIPGMRKSIKKGMKTPLSKCAKRIDW